MRLVLATLVVAAFIACSNAAQKTTFLCRYTTGNPKQFDFIVTKDAGATIPILKLFGVDPANKDCSIAYTAGQPNKVDVVDNAGSDVNPLPCGVTKSGSTYTLKFRTASGENCITKFDEEYTMACTFATQTTDATQAVTLSGTSVTTTVKAGSPTSFKETLAMVALNKDESAVSGPVALGAEIKLKVTLTLAGADYATGVKVITCSAEDGGTRKVDLLDATGCSKASLGIIAMNNGFQKSAGKTTLKAYVSESPLFPAFIFVNKGGTIIFKCVAKFCYKDVNKNCDKSCTNQVRKRRSVDDTEEERVIVMIRVTTGNSSVPAPRGPYEGRMDECSNRSYVIGIAILGCVLALSVIVSIGMFIISRNRNHGNGSNDKFGYENKCVS